MVNEQCSISRLLGIIGIDMVGLVSRSIVAMTVRMPKWFVRIVSRRYVAGSTLEEAVAVMKKKVKEGACFTIDVLEKKSLWTKQMTF